jgi:protein-tyrosine phosphatase
MNHNGSGTGGSSGQASIYYKGCVHKGLTALWDLPSGGLVFAGKKSDLEGDYELILDCTGDKIPATSTSPLSISGPRVEAFSHLLQFRRKPATHLHIDWPDAGVPPVTPEIWRAIIESVKGNLAVCCVGGHGRTGTALVALWMAQHYDEKRDEPKPRLSDIVTWIRKEHCENAVETMVQVQYLRELAVKFGYETGNTIYSSYSLRATAPANTATVQNAPGKGKQHKKDKKKQNKNAEYTTEPREDSKDPWSNWKLPE